MLDKFYRVPPDAKGFAGLTRILIGNDRWLACVGTGKDVEALLLREREKRS